MWDIKNVLLYNLSLPRCKSITNWVSLHKGSSTHGPLSKHIHATLHPIPPTTIPSEKQQSVSFSLSVIFIWTWQHNYLQFISDLHSEFASYFADMKSYAPTFTIFSSPFDADCEEEVPLHLQMEVIDLLCSEDLKSKFLAYHIINFYKNHMLPSGWFSSLLTPSK